MQIEITTDKNIDGNERLHAYLENKLSESLSRFGGQITRLTAHLSDDNAQRTTKDDKRCVLEAHVEGLRNIAVTGHGDDLEHAINAAVAKLKSSLDTAIGKLSTH